MSPAEAGCSAMTSTQNSSSAASVLKASARPMKQPRERFEGELLSDFSIYYLSWAQDYLVFADRVVTVDFRNRTVRTLFVAPPEETILWASRLRHEKPEVKLSGVATNRSVRLLDDEGSQVFSAPWAYDRESYHLETVTQMEDPLRYRVSYSPRWYLELEKLETLPKWVVEYDPAGRETTRYVHPAAARDHRLFQDATPTSR